MAAGARLQFGGPWGATRSAGAGQGFNDFICVFLDTRVVSHLPRFRLLLKSHKSLCVDANGKWASRPIVGLIDWSTTALSILMATAGQILLKLDEVFDELNTPVRDTHDLLARFRVQVNSRRGNDDLVLTNFDFNALYTRDWFHDLDGEVLSHLSTYERDFMQFIFASISTEAKDLLISELPFLDVSQAPALLGLWLLNLSTTTPYF